MAPLTVIKPQPEACRVQNKGSNKREQIWYHVVEFTVLTTGAGTECA